MATKPHDRNQTPHDPSRRELLKRVGMAGTIAAVPAGTLAATAEGVAAQPSGRAVPPPREALEALTAVEADTLEAIVARLIPTDENGPGAVEARAAHYIDRALIGPLASSRAAYNSGLAAINAYAEASKGAPFAALPAKDQDAVLTDMEKNAAPGFRPSSAAFFNMVRTHTIQGTFCDPYYGGNANFVGWDLIGYPGLRMAAGTGDQRLVAPKTLRQSAYDQAMFAKKGGGHGH
jgi:gluconate 2-dehydrogenase gamma chain